MSPFHAIALSGALFLSGNGALLACGGIESWVDADPRADVVASIGAVSAAPLASESPQIEVTVSGELSTGGWSEPQLVPVTYIVAPYDGIWEVYVMAIPPEEMATQVITPYEAKVALSAGEDVIGYRLISADGCVTLLLQASDLPVEDGCRLQPLAST